MQANARLLLWTDATFLARCCPGILELTVTCLETSRQWSVTIFLSRLVPDVAPRARGNLHQRLLRLSEVRCSPVGAGESGTSSVKAPMLSV